MHVGAEQPARAGLLDGVPQPLRPPADIRRGCRCSPARAPSANAGDRHRLDHGERILLHQHAVLEGAGLGFVGVADDVVRPDRLAGHRVPLAARWGRPRRRGPGASASVTSLITPSGPICQRPAQRGVSASCAVGSRAIAGRPARRGGAAGAPGGRPHLRDERGGDSRTALRGRRAPRRDLRRASAGAEQSSDRLRARPLGSAPPSRVRTGPGTGCAARPRRRRWSPRRRCPRRRSCAPSARTAAPRPSPGRRCRRRRGPRGGGAAGARTARRTSPPRTLRRAARSSRGADVIERARADPANARLHGVQRRQQQVRAAPAPSRARRAPRARQPPARVPAVPAGCRRPEHRGDGGRSSSVAASAASNCRSTRHLPSRAGSRRRRCAVAAACRRGSPSP